MSPQVPTLERKIRSREVTSVFDSYHPYANTNGNAYDVWITDEIGIGTHKDDLHNQDIRLENCWVSHDSWYRQILIPKSDEYSNILG